MNNTPEIRPQIESLTSHRARVVTASTAKVIEVGARVYSLNDTQQQPETTPEPVIYKLDTNPSALSTDPEANNVISKARQTIDDIHNARRNTSNNSIDDNGNEFPLPFEQAA